MLKMRLGATTLAVLLLALLVALPAVAQEDSEEGEGESARGSTKIEDEEMGEADTPNEVKTGCAFRIDFFGFDEQTVPVRLSLQPPSGDRELTERSASLQDAHGNEPSGSLHVDLTEELSEVAPADSEDFDYKVRVDVVVKESEGHEVTKSSMLFLDCEEAAVAYRQAQQPAEPAQPEEPAEPAQPAPVQPGQAGGAAGDIVKPTQVAAGSGGLASDEVPAWTLAAMMLGVVLLAAPPLLSLRRRPDQG